MLVALNSCSIRIVYGWSLCRSSQSPGFHSGSDEVDAPFFKFLSLPCVSSLPTEVDDDVTVAVTAFPPSFLPTLLMFICLPGNLSNHSHISISSRLPQLAPSSLSPHLCDPQEFLPSVWVLTPFPCQGDSSADKTASIEHLYFVLHDPLRVQFPDRN
jgi:hypothetical protein